MATVFWDIKGVLLMEFMQQWTTITSEDYCETQKVLHKAIQNKRRGMLTPGVVLLHESASPYAAARTRALLEHFNWELFDHPPYNPDFAWGHYHLFTYLQNSTSIIMSWWKVSKCGLAYRQQTSLQQVYENLFPDTISASVPTVTKLRSSLSMFVFFVFFIACFVNSSPDVTFRIALVKFRNYDTIFSR
jgi:hypothetical protein